MRADGVILVSIPKSGTHLISQAMDNLGFTLRGVCGVPWTRKERAYIGYWMKRIGLMQELCNSGSYLWERTVGPADSTTPPMPAPWTQGKCFVIHELPLYKIEGSLYRGWEESGDVKFIFNYRDPRACLTSYVYWLRENKNMEPAPDQLAYRAILNQFDFPEALSFAIDDPNFPGKLHFQTNAWLFHHPKVLNIRYEDLVISINHHSEGQRALRQISNHVGAEHCYDSPYDRGAKTFRKGEVDGWRADWTPENIRRYDELHGDVLQTYGYPMR